MPKAELQKHTLNLFRGDWDEIASLHPDVDTSLVIRQLVRAHIKNVKTQAKEQARD